MELKEQINQLQAEILALKLEQPFHPALNGMIQELDKLDDLQRAERKSSK